MKQFILYLFAAALLTACGSNDPEGIAKEFATAYLHADYDTCNDMMEEEEFTPSDEMSEAESTFIGPMRKEAKKMKYVITVDKEDSDIDEEDAYIYLDITSKSDSEYKGRMRVSLEKDYHGKWIVDSYNAP